MEIRPIGSSPEYIIRPGETLQEILDDRKISQKELSIKTEVSPTYINNIISGKKAISANMAKKLEYALGIKASFWNNLQSNYDSELIEFNELNNISPEESAVLNRLKEVLEYFETHRFIDVCQNSASRIFNLRKFFQVSNLTAIPDLKICGAFRKSESTAIDPYVMYAWIKMCELEADTVTLTNDLDIEMLKHSLQDIKQVMFLPADVMEITLKSIFQKCGIAFCIVKNFKNAPVQGFIKKIDNHIILCMTIRGSFADIFWFTLFHEIAHILNGDFNNSSFIDYRNNNSFDQNNKDCEELANSFSSSFLIDEEKYASFEKEIRALFSKNQDLTLQSINEFAKENLVQPYIIIGRLQKQRIIPYSVYSESKVRYKWIEE